MSPLLQQALAKLADLPSREQDAIAFHVLEWLADEEAWKKGFAERRTVIRRMAAEALSEDSHGETLPLEPLL
jgi:uncharacterized protein (DUF2336 family)